MDAQRAALDSIYKEARRLDTDELSIEKDGEPLIDYSIAGPHDLLSAMSVSKMATGIGIGNLFGVQGPLDLDQPVCEILPEWRQGQKRNVTFRMILNHTSGMQNVPSTYEEIMPSKDWSQLALCAEITDRPGSRFAYNNKAVQLLGPIVSRVTGQPIDDYLRTSLFEPMAITEVDWIRDESGNPFLCGGLMIRARDLVRIGSLYVTGGVHEGHQVVDPSWLDQMHRQDNRNNAYFGLLCQRRLDGNGRVSSVWHSGWAGQYLIVGVNSGYVIARLIHAEKSEQDEMRNFGHINKLLQPLL